MNDSTVQVTKRCSKCGEEKVSSAEFFEPTESHGRKRLRGQCRVCHHLFLGTNLENIQDCIDKRRHTHGERNGRAKLTEDDVREMRRLHASGIGTDELARRFSYSRANVCMVVAGKLWKFVG